MSFILMQCRCVCRTRSNVKDSMPRRMTDRQTNKQTDRQTLDSARPYVGKQWRTLRPKVGERGRRRQQINVPIFRIFWDV